MTALIQRDRVDGSKADTANGVNVGNFLLGTGNLWDCVQTLGVGVTSITAGTANLTQANAGLNLVDASGGNVVINMPACSAAVGALFQFKRLDTTANTVTINRAGSDTIDGASSLNLLAQYEYEEMRSNGVASWVRLNTLSNSQRARDSIGVLMPNLLINPDGEIAIEALGTRADGAYAEEQWYVLTQTGSISMSQVASPEDGYATSSRMTQSQASAQRMGMAQPLTAADTFKLRGRTITFACRCKLSSAGSVRMAILAWTGTADAITRDVVNNWASGTFTSSNFFLASNLSVVAVSAAQALGAGVAGTISVTGTLPSNANNLIVMYWTDGTVAQNVTLEAWARRVTETATPVDAIKRTKAEELTRCLPFAEASYNLGTTPGTATVAGAKRAWSISTTDFSDAGYTTFSAPKRAPPTITYYSTNGTVSNLYDETAAANFGGAMVQNLVSCRGFDMANSSAGLTVGRFYRWHWLAIARL